MRIKSGFTLIELLLVLLLIGVMASVFMPLLLKKSPSDTWPHVLDELNNIVFYTRQEAITNQKNFRLTFKSPKGSANDIIEIEQETQDAENPHKLVYVLGTSLYFPMTYLIPSSIRIKALYIGHEELFVDHGQKGVSCHVIPDGLVEETIIHMVRTKGSDGKEDKVSFKMSPFFGKFELLQGFVKPAR